MMQAAVSSAEIRFEYVLTFWQAVCNPLEGCIYRLLAILFAAFAVYLINDGATANSVLVVLGLTIVGFAWIPVFVGYGRWTPRRIHIGFESTGLVTDYGDASQGKDGGYPYKFLKVEVGLCGTSVIRSLSGHFIVVPTTTIARQRLRELIDLRRCGG